jgi:hypothetical protein
MLLSHSDEISGTTVLNNGTKIHWCESGSVSVIVKPNGDRVLIEPYSEHPYQQEIDDSLCDASASRPMTPEEEAEHEAEMSLLDSKFL